MQIPMSRKYSSRTSSKIVSRIYEFKGLRKHICFSLLRKYGFKGDHEMDIQILKEKKYLDIIIIYHSQVLQINRQGKFEFASNFLRLLFRYLDNIIKNRTSTAAFLGVNHNNCHRFPKDTISLEKLNIVRAHINFFPTTLSHYCQKDSRRL